MKKFYRCALGALILLAAGMAASNLLSRESSAAPEQKSPAAAAPQGAVERGKYLVEDVAMCQECHTPRDSSGNLDQSRWLQGAPIWIMPVHATSNWAMRAPGLAGFQGFTDEQGEMVLEKGLDPNGLPIQPPMHIYHMNHADAQAIIAYLRSLPSAYPHE
ncbi:MAG: c-type cytochrome [Candidatus Acidiferrales bacterium]